MVVDPLAGRGVTIEPASAATLAQLAGAGIEVKPARLVDLTIAGARYQTMKSTLDILLAAPEFDLVLAVVGSSARAQPDMTVRPIIDSAGAGKPLAAFLAPDAPEALAALSRAGVPNFRTPEACADAIAAALARRAPQPIAARSAARAGSGGPMLDELAAGALLERLGIAQAPAVALDAGITRTPPLPFPYPVAVKLLSAEIAHKSDIGGVVLGVADGPALLAAIATIRANVAERMPEARVARVLVQPMVSGLGEVLLGYRVDRDVGPLVMVAAGGVLTEIERDRSLRLAPVDLAAAHEMIAEVRGLIALTGYRGKSKGDLAALADAIVALSRLGKAILLPPGAIPASEAILTTRPALCRRNSGANALANRNGPRRLVSMTRSQISAVNAFRSLNGMPMFQPALLTRMSSRPNSAITFLTLVSIELELRWSSWYSKASPADLLHGIDSRLCGCGLYVGDRQRAEATVDAAEEDRRRSLAVPTGPARFEPTELSHNLLDAGIDRARIALVQLVQQGFACRSSSRHRQSPLRVAKSPTYETATSTPPLVRLIAMAPPISPEPPVTKATFPSSSIARPQVPTIVPSASSDELRRALLQIRPHRLDLIG